MALINLILCAFRVIYVHTERENKANGGHEHDNQRCNENLQTAESHHAGGFGMQMEQAADLWRQGGHRGILLQRAEQALLLWSNLRVP